MFSPGSAPNPDPDGPPGNAASRRFNPEPERFHAINLPPEPPPWSEAQTVRTLMLKTLHMLLETGLEQGYGEIWRIRVAEFQGFLHALELFAGEEEDQETLEMLGRLRAFACAQESCPFGQTPSPMLPTANPRSKT